MDPGVCVCMVPFGRRLQEMVHSTVHGNGGFLIRFQNRHSFCVETF